MSTHWARISERGSVTGLRLMLALRCGLGRWPFACALQLVSLWYLLFQPRARRASSEFLQRADPALRGRPWLRRWHSYRHFAHFGDAMMDSLLAWSGRIGHERLDGDGIARLDAAIDGGHGGLVLVAHHGNAAVIDALAWRRPRLELLVLAHTKNAVKFNAMIAQVARRPRPPLLEVSELNPADAQRMARCIARGGFVVIAADRLALNQGRSREVDFLDAPARFSEGPFRLATLLRCPLYTLGCVKRGDAFQVDFEPFDDACGLQRAQREAWIGEAMQRYADHLAARARRDPLQWYNFFPFWRHERPRAPCP